MHITDVSSLLPQLAENYVDDGIDDMPLFGFAGGLVFVWVEDGQYVVDRGADCSDNSVGMVDWEPVSFSSARNPHGRFDSPQLAAFAAQRLLSEIEAEQDYFGLSEEE